MRSTFAGLFLLLSFVVNASDTTAIVKGKVFDSVSGEPLIGANIIYGKKNGTITDANGLYFFSAAPGSLSIVFQYLGYKTDTKTLQLNSGDTVVLNVGLDQVINEIDQIIVSANRTEQKLSESTVSLSIIRPDILSKNHITDAEELINKSPGIEVLDGQASIRGGSGFSYGAGSRVLALIDGLPVVSADAGNIKWQFLPLENLSQVEIIKGAASVLYGSSALNGVINFRTAEASKQPVTNFFVESGLYDKPKQKNWIWWDNPRMNASVSFSHLQKYGNTDIGIAASTLADQGYRSQNDEKLGRLSFSLKHHNKNVEGLSYGVNLNTGLTVKRDFLLWENASTGALKQAGSTVLQLHGNFLAVDPFITIRKTDRYKHDLRMRIQSHQNLYPEKEQNNSEAMNWFAEYQSWYKFSNLLSINLGVSENFSLITSNFYGDHEGINLAGMAQAEVKPIDRMKFIVGVRLEYNSLDGNNDRVVPIFRTGINYRTSNHTFLRASFGQGYRYPSIAEKHASTTLGSVRIFPNSFIEAESGWNSELGIKQGVRLGNLSGQADLSVFYSRNTELIEYVFGIYPDPESGIFDFGFKATNVEQSRVYGVEMEYFLNYTSGEVKTSFSGGYIYLYPVEYDDINHKNSDVYLKYRRKHSGKLSLNTSYRRFEIGVDCFAKSKILNIDDVFLGEETREAILPGFFDYWNRNSSSYFLLDTSFGFSISEQYKLSLAVKNLTNAEYMGRPGDIRPQRSFGLRFSGRI